MIDIQDVFKEAFKIYCNNTDKKDFTYIITSTYRKGNEKSNPHALQGNAMDFTLRYKGDYAPIFMYNDLFRWMLSKWPYRAGIDNTIGNIHIHIDMGRNRPNGQDMPYFFKEDFGAFQYQITNAGQI